MLRIISKIPLFFLFRKIGRPKKLPMNLTLSLSYNCNSRCKTCNVYKKKSEELSLPEWEKIFRSIGKNLSWVTISGGEPFLHRDIGAVVKSLYDICNPAIINIPTNALLDKAIPEIVREITAYCRGAQIVVNISIDDIREKHDAIRGVPGNFDKAVKVFSALKSLNAPNLSVGIHTVISKYNVNRIPEIYEYLSNLNPDSYITEIAEERVELDTIGCGITPEYGEYCSAADFLASKLRENKFKKLGRITRVFRIEYYRVVKAILKQKKQVIPCYAGYASGQISPGGDVWMCCVKARPIGNLKDAGFDFKKVWFSREADIQRESIKKGECFCPLANAGYTNMLHDLKTLIKAGINLIRAV